jgi:hypothetical protein
MRLPSQTGPLNPCGWAVEPCPARHARSPASQAARSLQCNRIAPPQISPLCPNCPQSPPSSPCRRSTPPAKQHLIAVDSRHENGWGRRRHASHDTFIANQTAIPGLTALADRNRPQLPILFSSPRTSHSHSHTHAQDIHTLLEIC